MFPWRKGAAAWLDEISERRAFRIGLAIAIALCHILLFVRAAHVRIHRPFNSAPGEEVYYSNPDAPATRGYPRQPHRWSRLVVSRWDAQHYIGFAVRGLTACPKAPDPNKTDAQNDGAYLDCGLGWFPAYGLIGGAISDATSAPPDYTLMILSILAAAVINYLWISRAMTERLGKFEAYAALAAFNFFPTAFYVVTPYTEAATLALALGALVLLVRDRWLPAALLVGAATGLRAGAINFTAGFGIAALVASYFRRKDKHARWWQPLATTPLAVWGLVAQMLVFKILLGDASAYMRARHAFGADHYHYGRPFDPQWWIQGFTTQHMDTVLLVAVLGIIALCGREALRRFSPAVAAYILASTVAGMYLAVIAPYQYWGINRYLLACPLIFVAAGLMARRHAALFVLWLALSCFFYWHVEMCSYVAHGNPHTCPCLGRVEWTAPFDS